MVGPVSSRFANRAAQVVATLRRAGLFAELSAADKPLGKRIRDAQAMQFNYIVVVGEQESQHGTLTPRTRCGALLPAVPVDQFVADLRAEIATKSLQH